MLALASFASSASTLWAPAATRAPQPAEGPIVLRLRGGEDAAAPAAPPIEPRALTRDEITEKLNGVPCFCILNGDNGVVSMADPDGSEAAVCSWFTDPKEAKMVLEACKASNPSVQGLHLGVHGLGNAFTMCKGWPQGEGDDQPKLGEIRHTGKGSPAREVSLRLQGNHGLLKEVRPQLEQALQAEGIDKGDWLLPVFLCEELQNSKICPVFFHPADVAETWEKAGREKEKMPEGLKMLDLRSFVAMLRKPDNPWQLVQFIGSPEAIDLAVNQGAAGEEDGAAGAPSGGRLNDDAGGGGGEAEDEDALFAEEDEDED